MAKLLMLTLNEQEETANAKIISAISNYMRLEYLFSSSSVLISTNESFLILLQRNN